MSQWGLNEILWNRKLMFVTFAKTIKHHHHHHEACKNVPYLQHSHQRTTCKLSTQTKNVLINIWSSQTHGKVLVCKIRDQKKISAELWTDFEFKWRQNYVSTSLHIQQVCSCRCAQEIFDSLKQQVSEKEASMFIGCRTLKR